MSPSPLQSSSSSSSTAKTNCYAQPSLSSGIFLHFPLHIRLLFLCCLFFFSSSPFHSFSLIFLALSHSCSLTFCSSFFYSLSFRYTYSNFLPCFSHPPSLWSHTNITMQFHFMSYHILFVYTIIVCAFSSFSFCLARLLDMRKCHLLSNQTVVICISFCTEIRVAENGIAFLVSVGMCLCVFFVSLSYTHLWQFHAMACIQKRTCHLLCRISHINSHDLYLFHEVMP